MYVCATLACLSLSPPDVRKGIRHPRTGITEGWEPPDGGWELDPSPSDKQSVLLTAEASLLPQDFCFLFLLLDLN